VARRRGFLPLIRDRECRQPFRLLLPPVPLLTDLLQHRSKNLEALLGVRFLATEFTTSNGRIDTLGLDETRTAVQSFSNTSGQLMRTSSIRGCSTRTG
jgi:hypothetical protein